MSALPTPVEPTVLPVVVSLDERRDRIMAVLERTALDIGAELLAAKDEHPGSFVAWVETSLPFGLDKAERLMAITRTFATCDDSIRSALPPAWSALYELTRLPSERLKLAIETGVVRPDTTVREAKELARRLPPPLPPADLDDLDVIPPERDPDEWTPRLSCDIVAQELMRYSRSSMSDTVADMLKDWFRGRRGHEL